MNHRQGIDLLFAAIQHAVENSRVVKDVVEDLNEDGLRVTDLVLGMNVTMQCTAPRRTAVNDAAFLKGLHIEPDISVDGGSSQ